MLSNGALRDAPVSSAGVGRGRGPCSSICVRGLIPWARRTTASISSPQRPFRRGHRPCCGRGRRGAPRPGDEATMHPRDLFALLLSVVAVYIALQREGGVEFREAWFHPLAEHSALEETFEHVSIPLRPRPVVADLNGDGQPEVVVATTAGRLQVVRPSRPGRRGDGFRRAAVAADVPIAEMIGDEVPDPLRPVAIAAGYLDPQDTPPRTSTPAPRAQPAPTPPALRKMVVVVVTAGGTVLCFDHNLRLLWSRMLWPDGVPRGAYLSEATVHVSPRAIADHDRGSVIVGLTLESGGDTDDGVVDLAIDDDDPWGDPFHLAWHDLAPPRSKFFDGDSKEMLLAGLDGRSGVERWRHASGDWLLSKEGKDADSKSGSLELEDQYNYKMTAEAVEEARRQGERACGAYRHAVLTHTLPHRWASPYDASVHLAFMAKSKDQAHARDRPHLKHMEKPTPKHGSSVVSAISGMHDMMGGVAGGARGESTPKAGGSAVQGGVEVAPGAAGMLDHVGLNAVVAHSREGIEIVDVQTGKAMCSVVLAEGQLHADVNRDGMVDHAWAVGEDADAHLTGFEGTRAIGGVNRCWGYVTSGMYSSQHRLFDGSLCKFSRTGALYAVARQGGPVLSAPVEVAVPNMLPVTRQSAPSFLQATSAPIAAKDLAKSPLVDNLVVFLNSRGELVAFSSDGRLMWERYTEAWWVNKEGTPASHRLTPTLKAFRLANQSIQFVMLAAGSFKASVVSPAGNILTTMDIRVPPVQPLIVADFDGDGLTDILAVSHEGVYAYAQILHPGALPFRALVGVLGVALVLVYLTHASQQPGQGRQGRDGGVKMGGGKHF